MPSLERKFAPLLLSVASGLLLSAAWPVNEVAILLFIGFVPLLFVEDYFSQPEHRHKKLKLFGYFYLAFLIWNICTTWWVYKASLFGAMAAIVCNTLFMAIVFYLFHFTKNKLGKTRGYISLIFYWLAFEYLHLNWDISWPWLTLGNGFSMHPEWIQWYEYTGILGGSLWLLAVNILIFDIVKKFLILNSQFSILIRHSSFIILLFLIPLLFSKYVFRNYQEEKNPVNAVVVQPNIDPYNEKFSRSSDEQLAKLLRLASTVIDSNTDYIVGPETAIPDGLWENQLDSAKPINTIKTFISRYPKLNFIAGLSSYKAYQNGEKPSATARKFTQDSGYYDAFNTAMQIHSNNIELYHKSKLVPGVELMPFPFIFGFFGKFAIDLGGTVGSLGIQEERTVFTNHKSQITEDRRQKTEDRRSASETRLPSQQSTINNQQFSVAPVICYESIYGDFLSGYIRNGANLFFIITNDGWWGDTPGYKQHLSYGRLRAIEFRRSIARSANTGISCFINQRGDISQQTKWWEEDVIKSTINTNSAITFYAKHGDYIGRIAAFVAIALLLITFVKRRTKGIK